MFQTSFFDLRELYSKYLTLYWFAMILWQRLNFFAFILCILYKCFTKCVNISKKNLILIFVKTTNFTKYRNILRYMLQLQVISFIGFLFWERNLIKYKLCLFQNSHVIVNKPFTSFTQLSFRKVVVLLIISIYKFGLTVWVFVSNKRQNGPIEPNIFEVLLTLPNMYQSKIFKMWSSQERFGV